MRVTALFVCLITFLLAAATASPDDGLILLNTGPVNTSNPPTQSARLSAQDFSGKRLHLIQLDGPVQPEWHSNILSTGVEIVTYIPNNAYLVYGSASSLSNLQSLSATAHYLKWDGNYLDDYKIQPAARTTDAKGAPRTPETDMFTIQMVADDAVNADTLAVIHSLKTSPIRKQSRVLNYLNVETRIPPDRLHEIAARPDVVSIHLTPERRKVCERQDQIIAGNLSGNAPSGAGYLSWLSSSGFSQEQFNASNFAVDISDSGVDNGAVTPNHFGLYAGGVKPGSSRIIYNRLAGTPNSGSTLSGCDGHGNINTHIIGGFNNWASGSPHTDSAGYHYGLGVCPFVKIGSSVIFDPSSYTDPNYTTLISTAYKDSARISSNSWGGDNKGAYTVDCQEYDALVRDAQPSGSPYPVAGNQEMSIVFAAGNAGSGSGTVGEPGGAKNVISVGASENVQAFGGADGCGIADTAANSAFDMAAFSSRGPCKDGRVKPDIVAPGTHISGGVAQAVASLANGTQLACYDGSGVCGGVSGDKFFPSGQQWYTASSGTSHSTPAVAGACALVRQFFINLGLATPSPAMTKAILMNSARYMNGSGANDNLYSNNQGMGLMNLGAAFDTATSHTLRDQLSADMFTATGQTRVFTGTIPDPAKPFRVTLAWTDAPGATSGNAYKNDLDLAVTVGGNQYLGNVFSGANSATGGSADRKNNVESVFLPAGVSGSYMIIVTAANINSDGVPNVGGALDQDFALVISNGAQILAPVIEAQNWSLLSESCAPANGGIDPDEEAAIGLPLKNIGLAPTVDLKARMMTSSNIMPRDGGEASYGALTPGDTAVTRTFKFRAFGSCGQIIPVIVHLWDGATSIGDVNLSIQLGKANTAITYSYTGPAVTIPDNNSAGVNVPLSVSGFVGTTADIDFRIDGSSCSATPGSTTVGVDHTYVGDIVFKLTSPSGKSVTLINRSGGSGRNFCQTLLNDQSGGASINAIQSSGSPPLGPPYTGTFTPANPLSVFNGYNPNGTWTLNVSDLAGADTGNVRAFSLIITPYTCCVSVHPNQDDQFTTNNVQPEGAFSGWSCYGFNSQGFAWSDYDETNKAMRATVAANPSLYRVTGLATNLNDWLPYAYVGANNHVRVKYYLFASGQTNPSDTLSIPNLRVRASNRSAVNSMLEVFHHLNSDPANDPYAGELRPSSDPARPSLYRVDFDPVDVPYLAANAGVEGIQRAFEVYATMPQENGSIEMAESEIGTYPASMLSAATPAIKVYQPSPTGAGDLAVKTSAELDTGNYIAGASEGEFAVKDTAAPPQDLPTYGESAGGITLDCANVPSNRIGVINREFTPGNTFASLARVEENKQYTIRWHAASTQYSNLNAQARFRARSIKFAWSQKLEIGGAWATGGTDLNPNNSIAQQALPGAGCQNPDKYTTDTAGGWYTMIVHTPMSPGIRPEYPDGTPLTTRMPNIAAQPGPGADAPSHRDLRVGCDLIDTISGGLNKDLEKGNYTLDRIEIRRYDLISD